MITDKDVNKLKEVFATKDEFDIVKKDVRFLKDDVKVLKEDVKVIKYDLNNLQNSVHSLSKDVMAILEIVGDNRQKLEPRIDEHDEMLENHERRLDKVEDKVFPTI